MSYAGKRVLVTGGGGFIGSHLVEQLVRDGARVTAVLHYNGRGDRGSLAHLDRDVLAGVALASGDVRDATWMRQAAKGQEVVFHLAALIGIPYSYGALQSYIETNVVGTLNVAQAALEAGATRLVHVSTSEVYGTAQYVPIDERHPLRAQSPYAASKVGAESLALSYWTSFGLPVVVARPFNTYGPRQSQRAVIPAILSQLVRRAPTLRVGALTPRRDFVYVGDTVQGLLRIGAAHQGVGEVFNLGTGHEVSIAELVDQCADLVGHRPPVESDPVRLRPERSEVLRLLCDASRAAQLAGWQARFSLRDGLAATLRFVEQHGAGADHDGDGYVI